jgi:UDP-N-acetylmuramate: L-alanyl-gamma-D-glutamyl-meso-diaminopimelate ligase
MSENQTPSLVADPARKPPPVVNWDGVRRVHVMGICGSAMGAFAGMLRARGYEVRGSDKGAYPPMSTRLEEQGIKLYEGYMASNLDWGPDVVVVGNVIRPIYPEAVALRERGLPACSLPQALASLFIAGKHSVVVAGTHGKTTTSSMVAWLLHEGGLDPGFMIGGITGGFGTNHRVSEGPVFVVEGDEYDTAYFDKGPKFLHYMPTSAAITNIEFDHADIFPDIEAIERVFERFVALVPEDGRLLIPQVGERCTRVARDARAPIWTFGLHGAADVRASAVRRDDDGTHFTLHIPGEEPLATSLSIWGEHNVLNALTAAGLAYCAGATAEAIARALPTFSLPKKRQELRGIVADVPVVDDFAHHPTAITETVRATRSRYPGRRVLALFEVESNTSRRRVFQTDFGAALGTADRVWFCSPHAKADGLPEAERLDLSELVGELVDGGTPAETIADIDVLADAVARAAEPGRDVILAMSGRDFHGVHTKLLDRLGAHHA